MTAAPAIRIEALTGREQFSQAVRLQKEIWQFEDIELLPVRLFVVATKVGGQAFGAYDGRELVAFALAIPGIKRGFGGYLHSHMVGVAKPYRNFGIGRMLKLAQRHEAMQRGIELMEWTFDPLEIKNAYFNIERLGAIVRRHVFNQYGTTTSVLHAGLPTDRVIAEWWLRTPRVEAAVAGHEFERSPIALTVPVPNQIAEVRESDIDLARQMQSKVSQELSEAFERGLTVVGFEKTAESGNYLLGKWQ